MAEVINYVDRDVVGGAGDGSSWANAYATMTAWENAEDRNLQGASDWEHCYFRASSGTADTAAVDVLGWTTTAEDYILMEAASTDRASASGWDTAKYRLQVTDNHPLIIEEDFVRLDGLQIGVLYTAAGSKRIIWCTTLGAGSALRIDSCYIKGHYVASSSNYGIVSDDADAGIKVFNCIITDNHGRGVYVTNGTVNLYNCTVYNSAVAGVQQAGGTLTADNCAVFNTADDFSGTITVDYCASDDNDGTNNVAESGGGAAWPSDFTAAGSGNFTLVSGSNLIGATTDQSGGLFSDDIEGTARGAAWDLGAFEYVAAGGTTYNETCADGVAVNESAAPTACIFGVSAADGVGVDEVTSGPAIMPNAAADSIATQDSALGPLQMLASAADSLTLNDAASAIATFLRAAADGITLDDAATMLATYLVSAADGIAVDDSASAAALGVIEVLAADGIALDDSSGAAMTLVVTCTDSITTDDSVTATFQIVATAADGVALNDAVTVTVKMAVAAADGVDLSDAATALSTFLVQALDGVALQDVAVSTSGALASGRVTISFTTKYGSVSISAKKAAVTMTPKVPSLTLS